MTDLLEFEEITIERFAAGTYVNGRFVKGAKTTNSNVKVNVQPLTGKELDQVPEGDRFKNIKKLFTKFAILDKDVVTYNGEKYEVLKVFDWSAFCTEHYQAHIARIEKQ